MTTYCSSSSVFMTNNTPSGARKHRESTRPGTRKTGEMFFFLLLLSFFRRASSVLSESLTMILARNNSILHWAVHCPIAFFTTPSTLAKRSKDALELYGFVGTPFVILVYACARNRHVATSLQLSKLRTPERLLRVDVLCQRFVALLPSYLCCLAAVLTADTNCFTR